MMITKDALHAAPNLVLGYSTLPLSFNRYTEVNIGVNYNISKARIIMR